MRGFLKRILGGTADEAEQLCDVATGDWARGDWAPVPATHQRADWAAWLEEEAVEELELEPDELTPVQQLAAETLAAQRAQRRHGPSTGPHLPVSRAAERPLASPPPLPVAQLGPLTPVTGPQPRVAPAIAASASPVTGPLPRVEPAAATPPTGPLPRIASPLGGPLVRVQTAADVLAYLSPEERAIVEAQHAGAAPTTSLAPPPTTRARFVSAPVATCSHRVAAARPSQPRMPAIRPRRELRALRPLGARPTERRPTSSPNPEPAGDWTAMLKAYGEHLTDEELLVLRSQLS